MNKKPRKSILKKSLSFVGDKDEVGTPKATDHTSADFGKDQPIKDSIEFLSAWKEINHNLKSLEKFFHNRAKPQDFSSIFSHGIELELLSEIIEITGELAHQ